MRFRLLIITAVIVVAAACDGSSSTTSDESVAAADTQAPSSSVDVGEQRFPDVIGASGTAVDAGWDFDATLSSPYDTPERYADAWRVVGPDGAVLGVRELLHDHANEQPFTRSLRGVEIPADIDVVTIEARDSTYGWGGRTVDVSLDRG